MQRHTLRLWSAVICAGLVTPTLFAGNPYASDMISYDPGSPEPDFIDPYVTLGEPARMTGIGMYVGVVSPFNPPWLDTQIVSIGPGGHLTVRFHEPIVNDPDNLYGIDFIVFGNTGFIDLSYPSAIVDGVFGNDGGVIAVSADGEHWETIPGVEADGLFPPLAYLDAGPYDEIPGSVLSDFRRPVDPALTLDDLMGSTHDDVVARYYGSGGGAGVDLSSVGLSQISYVRISNPAGANVTVEVDAFVRVSPWTPGDLNFDGSVNLTDMIMLINEWGPASPGGVPADLDGNSSVGLTDLLILINNWGS